MNFQFSIFPFYNLPDINAAFPFYLYSKVSKSHRGDNVKELKAGVAIKKSWVGK